MENVKVLINNELKDVWGIFYAYKSNCYFIYTEKEIDENDYVLLYMAKVGKETQNTPTGVVETGSMIAIEITDPNEQQLVQSSISLIVEDKKNDTVNPEIQYLSISMVNNLKILGNKKFRLLKELMRNEFNLTFEEAAPINQVEVNNSLIVDYRAKFFELEGKNQELESENKLLKDKLEQIKKIME